MFGLEKLSRFLDECTRGEHTLAEIADRLIRDEDFAAIGGHLAFDDLGRLVSIDISIDVDRLLGRAA